MKRSIIIAVIITIISANTATAQLQRENIKIRNGVNNGELTARETYQLRGEERHLRSEAVEYKRNDGRIGPLERRDLMRDKRKLDRDIFIKKHNCRKRF